MNATFFSVASIKGRLAFALIPLTLAAGACSGGDDEAPSNTGGAGTGGAITGSGGKGTGGARTGGSPNAGGTATGGAITGSGGKATGGTGAGGSPNAGGTATGGAITGSGGAGAGGMPDGTGGVVEPAECAGDLPVADVSAAEHRVTAGGQSLGVLPHFWTTFGLGRLGLYLDQSALSPEFQAQDKLSFDGRKWSEVFREQTVHAVANLELRRVRAHGLFHDDIGIYREENDTPVYDFTRSDDIFDFLVENGVAPIVELASMPADLALDPAQTVFDWNMIVSPPKNYDRWQGLVQAFVQHSVERYGADVVQNWYFEVWNEPECCNGKFWKGTAEDYFLLYDRAAAGVRAALPNGRVGGPVTSQPVELTGGQWEEGAGILFLDHVQANSSPLDFFTFHTWAFIEGSVGGYFEGLDLLDSYGLTSLPIAITEFGPTWEFGLLGGAMEPAWEPAETMQGAAFVAQTYSNIAQRCAQEGRRFPITHAWWTLSDIFDEGYEDQADYVAEQNPFIGAMGVYSRESIHKPVYNAYRFLAQLGDEQLALGVEGLGDVGGMAARDTADGGIQVLVYNGQDPGRGFQDDTYYAVTGGQNVGVTVTGLNPDMAYDVTAYRADETRGNAFAAWDALGRPTMSSMTEEHWTALRNAMDSPAEPVGQALCGSSFSQTFVLSSPGVLLLTLEPAVAAP